MKIQSFLNTINPMTYVNSMSDTQKKITALATAAIISAVSFYLPASVMGPVAKVITAGVSAVSAVAYAFFSKGAKVVAKEGEKLAGDLKNDAEKEGKKLEKAIENPKQTLENIGSDLKQGATDVKNAVEHPETTLENIGDKVKADLKKDESKIESAFQHPGVKIEGAFEKLKEKVEGNSSSSTNIVQEISTIANNPEVTQVAQAVSQSGILDKAEEAAQSVENKVAGVVGSGTVAGLEAEAQAVINQAEKSA